ncbi:MAG: hypothetical protein ACKN9V_10460 [Pseudomonadota bacterium]
MLRIILTIVLSGIGQFGFCGELQGIQKTHQQVESTARQLSGAIDSLSHILGPVSRPVATESELSVTTILNGLKQLALDPARDPKDSFEALKKRYEQISKEPSSQKEELQRQINEQIKTVIEKLGYTPVQAGSATYQRNNEKVSVRFQNGEISVSPIKSLPPVD